MNRCIKLLLLCILSLSLVSCAGYNFVSGIIPHTVNFETNFGTRIDSINTTIIEESPLTSREDYLFDGWYLDNHYDNLVLFPYEVKEDVTFYAKWLKIHDSVECKEGSIKFLDSDYNSSLSYSITPSGFDYNRLSELGASGIEISVEYNVYYEKDYNIPFDIGYAGSPKYEIYIFNSRLSGFAKENLKTNKKSTHNRYSYKISFSNLIAETFTLTFSTDNIQNVIYFTEIFVSYTIY